MQKAVQRSQLDQAKLNLQERTEEAKLALRIAEDRDRNELESRRISSKEQIEGLKIGKDIAEDLLDG
jgi:multidrug efflux pump subunit AcrA (membrane-fusion protein)